MSGQHATCALFEAWASGGATLSPDPSTVSRSQLVAWIHAVLDALPIGSAVSDPARKVTSAFCRYSGNGCRLDPGFEKCNLRNALKQVVDILSRRVGESDDDSEDNRKAWGECGHEREASSSTVTTRVATAVGRAAHILATDASWGSSWYCGLCLPSPRQVAMHKIHTIACVNLDGKSAPGSSCTHDVPNPDIWCSLSTVVDKLAGASHV